MGRQSVGMMCPIWAPFISHTDGSMPNYGTGRRIMEARNATVNYTRSNNPDFGDDREIDRDNGVTAASINFEPSGMTDEDRSKLLGDEANADTTMGGYWVSDTSAPYGGFGYIEPLRNNGVREWKVWICLKVMFQEDSRSVKTREGQIEWGHPQLTGNMAALDIDNSGKLRYQWHDTFSTLADAKTKLYGLLNYTEPTVTT